MEPTWFSTVPMDATWIGIFAAISALGLIATAVVLVRQASPRARIDPDRVARRRDTVRTLAH